MKQVKLMSQEYSTLALDEAAAAVALEIAVVRRCAELGLVAPPARGYTEAELAELRRVRRLLEDLDLDHPAIEVVLRMRRRMLALQAEVRRLELELLSTRRRSPIADWIDADWDDMP